MAKEPELASDHRKTVCADSRCNKDSAHSQGSEGCYFSPPTKASEELLRLRDARTTLGKTATCRIGSDEVTINRAFFDSAIRNIDEVIRTLANKATPHG